MPEGKLTQDPETAQEWQEALDLANFFLALDACVQYGLVVHDMTIDIERCESIVSRARALGYEPRPVEQVLQQLSAERAG